MFVLKAICLVCALQAAIGEPSGKLEPAVNHVLEGGTAVFTCTVTGRDKENVDIVWYIALTYLSPGSYVSYLATSMTVITEPFGFLNFKNHTIVYNASYEEEVFELRINNVTKLSEDLDFLCGFRTPLFFVTSIGMGRLIVWSLPTSKPQCSFQGDIPPVIHDGESYPITLTCSLEDGDPRPSLTWYRVDQNQLQMISSPSINTSTSTQSITASDYLHEFTCRAVIGAIPDDPLTCSVIPYQPDVTTIETYHDTASLPSDTQATPGPTTADSKTKVVPSTCLSTGLIQALIAVAVIGWGSFFTLLIVFIYCFKCKHACSCADTTKSKETADVPMTSTDNVASYQDLQRDDVSKHAYASPSVYAVQSVTSGLNNSLGDNEAYQEIQ